MLDKRDIALQAAIPTAIVPRFSEFTPLTTPGDRILVAANGLFVEICRKWGYFIRRISDSPAITLPYGRVEEVTTLLTPTLPRMLLATFMQHAAANCDVEIGASVIWNEVRNDFRLEMAETIFADHSSLKYVASRLHEGDHLIVDCHSHAHHPAFFSTQDNDDDLNATKFSFVAGHCNLLEQSTAMRLCLKGIFEEFAPGVGRPNI